MDISIIIVNYNSSIHTINCVKSINRFTSQILFEIIVIDNNSQEKDFNFLQKALNNYDVKLIKSKINLGFGGGNQLGFQFSSGKHLAFINNDVEFIENSLEKLHSYSKTNPKIGLLGLNQINENNKVFEKSYRRFQGIRYLLYKQPKPYEYYKKLHKNNLTKPFEVDLVSGAFMFFKSEAYVACGGFDSNIFLYYEEMDICKRLKNSGYNTVFYPEAVFKHYFGKSSENVKVKIEYASSYLYVLQKNYNYFYYKATQFILIIKYGFKAIFKSKHRKPFFIFLKGGNSLVYSMKFNR